MYMAPVSGKLTLFLLYLLTFTVTLTHATLQLDPLDYTAFHVTQRHLGFTPHDHRHHQSPCNHPGVFCERIKKNNFTLRFTRLALDSHHLGGSLSGEIGKLIELRELTLSNNCISGQLPPEIVNCQKLEILNLKSDQFSGNVPSKLHKLALLRVLDLSLNRFSGDLGFLKYLSNLETLSLDGNLFSGKIPRSLKSMGNLRLFSISGNEHIEGPFPVLHGVELASFQSPRRNLALKRFRLAENSSTRRPNGTHPAAAPKESRQPSPSPTQAPSQSAPMTHNHHKNKKLRTWLLGFLSGALVGVVSGMIASVLGKWAMIWVRNKRKRSGLAIFSPLIKKAEGLTFLNKEDGLAELEVIGKGGCGQVYKAQLPGSNGKIIAIKKIITQSPEAGEPSEENSKLLDKKMRQIQSEIRTVGQIRHRNLLPLLAHVPKRDCQYLVYEYMKNGSLQDTMQEVIAGQRELDWLARYRIASGIAAGLEYLHMNNNQKIIHRDLKPANILLDDDMEPRITDFGLAKVVPIENTHMSSSNVAGTIGYIAPEYHQTYKFTEICDVYSLGVILGVLVMGKLPSDEFFVHTAEVGLVKCMRSVMSSEDPKQALDPRLIGKGYEEQMVQVLKIACFCTLDDPKQRPNSKDIRCMLSQIKH